MVAFEQLLQCHPEGFTHAGQTYQRMATSFGQVLANLQKVNTAISAAQTWQGTAQQNALGRGVTLARGVQSGTEETAAAGKALTTFGQALQAAQGQLRAAVAQAQAAQLIVLPSGDTLIPGWAYSYPANVTVLPAMQAAKVAVDAQIKLALAEATAADTACAVAIGKLAAGKLIQEFGNSSTARTVASGVAVLSAVGGLATTLRQINAAGSAAPITQPAAPPVTATQIGQSAAANSQAWQNLDPAAQSAGAGNVTNTVGTGTAQQVSGTIGSSALASVLAVAGLTGTSTPVAAAPGREVIVNGHKYVIYGDEVREGGSVSWRARNPGNIRRGDHYGAIPGATVHAGVNGQFAVFPDEASGMAAIKRVLDHYGHVTIEQAMNRYAPAADNNNPSVYAASVARQIGVPANTYVDSLSDAQMTSFAEAIKRVEGWRVGTIHTLDDPTLPAEVQAAIRGQ